MAIDKNLPNSVYQKQQQGMYQITNQLKSSFIEIETLLSQISYFHYNIDEYEKSIHKAQNDAALKNIGGITLVGAATAVVTGGMSLFFLPAIGIVREVTSYKQRKKIAEVEKDKEFKRNTFLFKKALNLIIHMSEFPLKYQTNRLNELTTRNLQREAQLLISSDSENVKKQLMNQSIDMYTKLSLPIEYNQQTKPAKLVESILDTSHAKNNEKDMQSFLN